MIIELGQPITEVHFTVHPVGSAPPPSEVEFEGLLQSLVDSNHRVMGSYVVRQYKTV